MDQGIVLSAWALQKVKQKFDNQGCSKVHPEFGGDECQCLIRRTERQLLSHALQTTEAKDLG